jgi:hypothetical protein
LSVVSASFFPDPDLLKPAARLTIGIVNDDEELRILLGAVLSGDAGEDRGG